MRVNRGKCKDLAATGGWKHVVKCPAGYVMIGRAASGGNKDARFSNGKKYSTWMRCCEAQTDKAMEVIG
jgi:hypothetical protein